MVNSEVRLSGLEKFAKYSVTVQAFNAKGDGPTSDAVIMQTLEDGKDFIWSVNCKQLFLILKVKQSRNRPGVAQRVSGGLDSQISWHSAREGGEVVSLMHRPPFPPGNVPGTHFH